jgi:hypothetical protein
MMRTMTKKTLWMILLVASVGTALAGCLIQRNPGVDALEDLEGVVSVAEAIALAGDGPEAPDVQTTSVAIYGRVGNLGAFFCPCFEIRSDGETVLVRHGLFDDEEFPDLDVSELRDGDWILVSGLLRTSAGLPPELWATEITLLAN